VTGLLLLAALSVSIAPVSGTTRLKPPGGAFAPLTTSQAVDYGATVDAVRGTVKIVPSATQKALAKGAVFTVTLVLAPQAAPTAITQGTAHG
jgi:hypothetical protein